MSSVDLNLLLATLLGDRYLHATFLYDVMHRRSQPRDAATTICRLTQKGWLFAPLHVRHHWVTAILHPRTPGTVHSISDIHTTLLDSAPACCTRKDIRLLLERIGIVSYSFASPVTQPPHSNECGLHVVLYGLLCACGMFDSITSPDLASKGPNITLAGWRTMLPTKMKAGLRAPDARDLLACISLPVGLRPSPGLSTDAPPAPSSQSASPPSYASTVSGGTARSLFLRRGPQQGSRAAPIDVDAATGQPAPGQPAPVISAPAQPVAPGPQRGNSTSPIDVDATSSQPAPITTRPAAPAPRSAAQPARATAPITNAPPAPTPAPAQASTEALDVDAFYCEPVAPRLDTNEGHAALADVMVNGKYIAEDILNTALAKVNDGHFLVATTQQAELAHLGRKVTKLVSAIRASSLPVAFPVYTDGHYVLAVLSADRRTLRVYDSFSSYRPVIRDRKIASLVRCFTDNAVIQHVKVPQQKENECAVCVVQNAHAIICESRGVTPPEWSRDLLFQVVALNDLPEAAAIHIAKSACTDAIAPVLPQQAPADIVAPPAAAPTSHTAAPRKTSSAHDAAPISPPAPHDDSSRPPTVRQAAIRKLLHEIDNGHIVEAHWALGDDAGRWVGTVEDRCTSNATVAWTAYVCDTCHCWHEFEDPITILFPFPRTLYFDVSTRKALPEITPPCDCDDLDLDSGLPPADKAPKLHATLGSTTVPEDKPIEPTASTHTVRDLHALPLGSDERIGLRSKAAAAPLDANGSIGRRWFIYPDRPPHVHTLVWKQIAKSTRACHITWLQRIRGMPDDLLRTPFTTAIVELVLRFATQRKWAWSTIASAFSAVSSALRALKLYTAQSDGIDISQDPVFTAAFKRAQHLGRVTAGSQLSVPLTPEQFRSLCNSVNDRPSTWLLCQMAWFFAARVGDLRQCQREDITIRAANSKGDHEVAVRFRFGKGAAFWGPYTIHAFIPHAVAQALDRHCKCTPMSVALFLPSDQERLSRATRNYPGCNLRSFRRGALVDAAKNGASDDQIQLLSGHKRRDTLLRYLGWGLHSASARSAAAKRRQLAVDANPEGAGPDPLETVPIFDIRPAKMGAFSGYCGHGGQRVRPPPAFIPLTAPSSADLGLDQAIDASTWPIHVKNVDAVDWQRVRPLAINTPLIDDLDEAINWCSNADRYNVTWAPWDTRSIPYAKFNSEQLDVLIDAGKLMPYDGPAHSFTSGFLLPQPSKSRLRPIFEPYVNRSCKWEDHLTELCYPYRLERRSQVLDTSYVAEFDFSAYFDQIGLHPDVRSHFVVRPRCCEQRYVLTRLPMGATFAPGVAQTITWMICFPLHDIDGVVVSTMLDNVRIAASNATSFVRAVRLFIERCDSAGIVINDRDRWNVHDDEIARIGRLQHAGPFTFLGECYEGNTVRNTDANLAKLAAAMQRMRDIHDGSRPDTFTLRQFAALVGLICWLAHTIDFGLWRMFPLLRARSNLVRSMGSDDHPRWDEPLKLQHSVRRYLEDACSVILRNEPSTLRPLVQPGSSNQDYDLVIIVDASQHGWGAYVLYQERIYEVRKGWSCLMPRSAHAEPRAATQALQWAKENLGFKAGNVAIVTDHEALVKGQRRWWSAHGGFSSSYYLNAFYAELYSIGLNYRLDVFFVQGHLNPADGPSRANTIKQELRYRVLTDFCFPDVSAFANPFRERPDRPRFKT